jgi:hypothetical protein
MKASTAGVYGAGIENRKRKVKSEIRPVLRSSTAEDGNSKSERSLNSENRIPDWRATFLTPVWLAKNRRHHFLLLGDASDLNIARVDEPTFPHLCGRPSRFGGQRHLA